MGESKALNFSARGHAIGQYGSKSKLPRAESAATQISGVSPAHPRSFYRTGSGNEGVSWEAARGFRRKKRALHSLASSM
jgi:hypothetical protein